MEFSRSYLFVLLNFYKVAHQSVKSQLPPSVSLNQHLARQFETTDTKKISQQFSHFMISPFLASLRAIPDVVMSALRSSTF